MRAANVTLSASYLIWRCCFSFRRPVSTAQGNQSNNPLATYVHLSRDWAQRRSALGDMVDDKLANAHRFLLSQRSFIDVKQPRWREDCHENARGDFLCVRFDCTQFKGATSVGDVYDALVFYFRNMEISISEKLGHITVREDYDQRGSTISHHRLLSTDSLGVTQEINRIMFARCENRDADDSYGIVAVDFVDDDDLHPFCPSMFVRKDITAAVLITRHCHKVAGGDEDQVTIVMQRAAFIKIHRSRMDLAAPVLRDLRRNIARWGEVMIQSMAERLSCHAT